MRRLLASALITAAASSLGPLSAAALADGAASTAATATTPAATTPAATTPTTPTAATPTTTTPAPATPAPVQARARLYLGNTFVVKRSAVTVPGREVDVQGFVSPYVAGQVVQVQATLNNKSLKTDRLRVKPTANGKLGTFTERLKSPAAGIVRVKVTHRRTPQMVGFDVRRAFAALVPQAGFGARSLFVDLVQQRLAALHVYIPQTGVFDQQTGLALDAYHRLLGWGEGNQSLDANTVAALLDGRGAFQLRYPHNGNHAEGDLTHQLLALANGSKVAYIIPISSGKPSTPTVLGNYRVYYRVPGYLPDGMYYSSFFYSGYAIHGYDPAPDYPASHGCMRIPISDAIFTFNWLTYGDWVDVYYR